MKWKEFLEIEDCDLCPIKKAELCGGGSSCYGGSPIDPPCCWFEDDTDLDEWIKEAYERQRRYEEYQDKLIREKKAKEEKAKKAADTRHKMRLYCMAEIVEIKTLEKRLKAYEKELSFARSLAFAINHTNEMFKYPERLTEKPEAQKTIDELKNQIEVAKEKYKAKRKEFYANRKQDHPTEKGGEEE